MKPVMIDDYLERVPVERRPALEKVRQTIRKAAPKAGEYIGCGLTAFCLTGRSLVAFGGWANHCAFYPMGAQTPVTFNDKLSGFGMSKGTFGFTRDKPLPAGIVRELVKAKMGETNLRTVNAKDTTG